MQQEQAVLTTWTAREVPSSWGYTEQVGHLSVYPGSSPCYLPHPLLWSPPPSCRCSTGPGSQHHLCVQITLCLRRLLRNTHRFHYLRALLPLAFKNTLLLPAPSVEASPQCPGARVRPPLSLKVDATQLGSSSSPRWDKGHWYASWSFSVTCGYVTSFDQWHVSRSHTRGYF